MAGFKLLNSNVDAVPRLLEILNRIFLDSKDIFNDVCSSSVNEEISACFHVEF